MKPFLLSLLLLTVSITLTAQSRWKKYDSIYFENLFIPNFSNLLMPKGYVEVLLSNSVLTANRGWSNTNDLMFELNGRYTYDYVTAIGNVGVSQNNRFNAGVELHYAIGYHDSDPNSSLRAIFQDAPPGFVQRARAVTSVGPRIMWRPFPNNLRLVYISTLQFPLAYNAAVASILGQQRVQWGNQFLYSFSPGKKLAFFARDDLYIYYGEGNNAYNQYYHALTAYSYFLITRHVFPFVSAGYSGAYGTDTNGFRNQFQSLPVGVGLQYQYSLRFTINAYYSQYVWAQNYNDWRTISLGFRGVF